MFVPPVASAPISYIDALFMSVIETDESTCNDLRENHPFLESFP